MFTTKKLADARLSFIRTENLYTGAPHITVRCTIHNETVEVSVNSDKWIDVAKEAYRLKLLNPEYSGYYNTICNITLGLAAKMEKFNTIYFQL